MERGQQRVILVVDDEVEIQRLLQQRFRKKIQSGDLSFCFAQNGVEALDILHNAEQRIDMVLTDIRMPQMDGLTLLANLADFKTPLKAVVLSAYGDMKNIRTAMNRGAFDFLTKPIDFEDLEITIEKTLTFVAQLREQQEQLQAALDRLHELVFYDELTGLYSHHGLLQKLAQTLELKRTQAQPFALLILEIERYAIIKSAFGHRLADRLLLETAERLSQQFSAANVVARTGENQFTVLWSTLTDLGEVPGSLEPVLAQLKVPFQLDAITVTSTVRLGIALSDLPYTEPEAFFQAADTALQATKKNGRRDRVIFDLAMQESAVERFNLEVNLQRAIDAGELSLCYQPVYRLRDRKIIGFEALARWHSPTLGFVSPNTFIPLAEETGLIVPLGEWVLNKACEQLGRWQVEFGASCPDSMSVNLSNLQLQSSTLLSCVDNCLAQAGLTGHTLRLEITESVLMENIQSAADLLEQLQQRHIQLLIDDFGTGYSSLAYLQLLPINALKIDRSFITDIEHNPTNFDITSSIIELAHQLGLEVIAEGLEKERHLQILNELNCEYGQGFLFSQPLDVKAATELIANQ